MTLETLDHMRMLEALLFAASEPMSLSDLQRRLPADCDVAARLAELQQVYEKRGVTLVRRGEGWAFRTAADLGHLLTDRRETPRRLSRAAMETLAIIAYNQPVSRAEIEAVRGVAISRGTLDQLVEAGWVKPGRRRESPGRPLTWITTPQFLDHFGLVSLADLPGLEELRVSGLLDTRPAVAALPETEELPFDDPHKERENEGDEAPENGEAIVE